MPANRIKLSFFRNVFSSTLWLLFVNAVLFHTIVFVVDVVVIISADSFIFTTQLRRSSLFYFVIWCCDVDHRRGCVFELRREGPACRMCFTTKYTISNEFSPKVFLTDHILSNFVCTSTTYISILSFSFSPSICCPTYVTLASNSNSSRFQK